MNTMAPAIEFSASYDRTTKIISGVICALLLGIFLVVPHVIFGILAVLIVALAYAYSPQRYTVSGRSILVRRLIGSARFPLEGVREARRATADDLAGSIRLWGSGGMFGYYGLFRTARLGNCWWYVTNRRNAVVVITAARTALFSPDEPDVFLTVMRTSVPVTETPGGELAGAVAIGGGGISTGAWIGAAIGLLALGIVGFSFLYSPGPPNYTLTPAALSIHDRFYPVTLKAADVDILRIQIVDIAVDQQWRPTARTNGFANAHYRSGWFRVANGQKVRMYRADGTRLVLLPSRDSGASLLLEVREPERFMEAVRKAWRGRVD